MMRVKDPDRMKALVRDRDLSYQRLADECGRSKTWVAKMIAGEMRVEEPDAQLVAASLGIKRASTLFAYALPPRWESRRAS
jgi:cyanate lyase